MTIIAAITTTGAEPPKLDRYRNEIAASLLGIKPHKANTEGLLALRRLAASAPDPDGDVVFLTSPRAINVIKACQGWVLADDGDGDDREEMEERVESAMLPIFMHLAPILQNVPGGPWAFVFDVLESVLERSSSTDKALEEEIEETGEDLIALTRALRLVLVLEELATRNKSLMAEWEGRRMGVLVVIRDLSVLGLGTLILTDFVILFDDLCFSTYRFCGCIVCTSFHMS
jgi:E3 ubiquitin-protein ligase listerin